MASEDDTENTLPCADKLAFDTKEAAEAAAAVAEWQHGTKLKAYACRHCGLWHLSTNSDE